MGAPYLLAETPRGGPFGHRFIIPPDPTLLSTDVEAYFQRAALGQGNNFISVNHQVQQHLPNGAVREGAETLLLAGVEINDLSDEQVTQLKQTLNKLLPDLAKLVSKRINWEEAGQQTLIIRDELGDWLRKDIGAALALPAPPVKGRASQTWPRDPKDERAARLIGRLLGLAVGAIILFIWFF
ncbi:MAG: hypothetical protein KAS94_08525 [Desulfobulbaceae bacterium]|nr:hypothetical protein [Desulfobulbaceae bacterium]